MTIEEAKSILKEMLQKEGTFKQKNMVVVLTGLMGTGKTTLLCRLFGKEPPAEYNSSGVVERSWRGLTQYILDMNELQLLDNHEDIFELVAKVKKTLGKNEPTAIPEERDESSKEFISQVEEKENASPPSFDEMVRKIRENPEECHGE